MNNSQDISMIFKAIQDMLGNPPVIVWGSGATAPFGLPTMGELHEILKDRIEGYQPDEGVNLEAELGKDKYRELLPQMKEVIWQAVHEADMRILEGLLRGKERLHSVRELVQKFVESYPESLTIVTTNYDRVLEHTLSYYGISYSDGFNGKNLSAFRGRNGFPKNGVRLIKVHGSLNWWDIGGLTRHIADGREYCAPHGFPQIVLPGREKYQETVGMPYRDLVHLSDECIEKARSLLLVGFGFNDEHLTPKVKERIQQGIPLVSITKATTPQLNKLCSSANQFAYLEGAGNGETKVTIKHRTLGSDIIEEVLEGAYWQPDSFVKDIF